MVHGFIECSWIVKRVKDSIKCNLAPSNIYSAHHLNIENICCKIFQNTSRGSRDIEQTRYIIIRPLFSNCDLKPDWLLYGLCAHLLINICNENSPSGSKDKERTWFVTDRQLNKNNMSLYMGNIITVDKKVMYQRNLCRQLHRQLTVYLDTTRFIYSQKEHPLTATPNAAVSAVTPGLILGGIISGVSWGGGSTPFTFCCTRYTAKANCSDVSFPIPFISHRFLETKGV